MISAEFFYSSINKAITFRPKIRLPSRIFFLISSKDAVFRLLINLEGKCCK
nr:hypothetical protein [Borreliella carolinensis]WNY65433.1 hypothetical protein QIA46_04520 [Borreliella carolinensis]